MKKYIRSERANLFEPNVYNRDDTYVIGRNNGYDKRYRR